MIVSLFFRTIREQLKMMLFWLLIDILLTVLCLSAYLPGVRDLSIGFLLVIPVRFRSMLGLSSCIEGLSGLFSGLMYGMLFPILGTIQMITLSNRLVLCSIEKGKLTMVLSSPNSRGNIAGTLYLVLALDCVLTGIVMMITGNLCGMLMYRDQFANKVFSDLCLGYICLLLLIASIGFFFSCRCETAAKAYGADYLFAGISFVLLLTGRGISQIALVRYLSFYSLFAVESIRKASIFGYAPMGIMIILAVLVYIAGVYAFRKRDLVF